LWVGHGRGGNGNVFYGVVAVAANGADREAVAARAVVICERDALFKELGAIVGRESGETHSSGIDSEAVILVLDIRSGDVDVGAAANIESISVMA
jgi:hypothetical protein